MEDYEYKSLTETIEKLKRNIYKLNILKLKYYEEMINYRMEYLIQQNKVNEAIEYIENNLQNFSYSVEYKRLLEILRGENK